jgi:hypothetical protein
MNRAGATLAAGSSGSASSPAQLLRLSSSGRLVVAGIVWICRCGKGGPRFFRLRPVQIGGLLVCQLPARARGLTGLALVLPAFLLQAGCAGAQARFIVAA